MQFFPLLQYSRTPVQRALHTGLESAQRRYNSTKSRNVSTTAPIPTPDGTRSIEPGYTVKSSPLASYGLGLQRLPTSNILRSLLLGSIFTLPFLSRPALTILRIIANSNNRLVNPDSNPILRAVLKPLLYDHFCAGNGHAEISKTRDSIKRIGYAGVILCYGAEIQVSAANNLQSTHACLQDKEIQQWKEGNLQTLAMAEEGDWLGIKYVGPTTLMFNSTH
nr:hypothetical protein CFP56_21345 [Quercus suber]